MIVREKSFESTALTLPDILIHPPKVPYFALRSMARMNLGKLREGMGGNTRDIVRRPVLTTEQELSGYKGPLPIRIYTPEQREPDPCAALVFFHGGGWFGGSMGTVEAFCRAVADHAQCVVVNVGYHLCPEHPFPHGLEDCFLAARWVITQAAALGIDETRITVGGDSTGGNLAAAVCLMARDRGDLRIAKQLLLYPALTLRDFVSPAGGDGSVFGRLLADWYVGGPEHTANPYVSPLLAGSLAGLPRMLMIACALDGLKEQNLRYAQLAADAGVQTECVLYHGTHHGCIDNTGTQSAAADMAEEAARFVCA